MSPLARQRAVILLVLTAALALVVAALVRSQTSTTAKVIIIGVLVGLAVGALLSVARGRRS